MAGNQNGSSSEKSNVFVSGLIQDPNPSFNVEGSWSRARNASKVTALGDLHTLSNESATALCQTLSYTPIGFIHLFEDKWAILSTDNIVSEIGLFDDSECSYHIIVQDPCLDPVTHQPKVINCPGNPSQNISNTNELKFSTFHLITGAAKLNFDCSYQIYWQDNLNPDRTLAFFIDDKGVPTPAPFYMKECCIDTAGNTSGSTMFPQGCITCTPTCKIDPDKALLASLVDSPCITVSKSRSGGSLPNGSYFASIAYTINQQKITDYFPVTSTQSLFTHQNLSGALDIKFSGLDTNHFDEFELIIVRNINQQTSAKRIGIYSTQTKEVFIDYINEELVTVPIEQIPIQTPVIERSALITSVGDYLVRTEPVTKFDFNYQPLANRIICDWISVQYPSTYYKDGGNNPSNLRDEIYPFFIRWVYNTGDRSSSYHIPGRAPLTGETGPPNSASDIVTPGERQFEVVNTAFPTSILPDLTTFTPYFLPDGGQVIAEGKMGYWESTEFYPQKDSLVWNLSSWQSTWGANFPTNKIPLGDYLNPAYQLCGTPIRHHKMPDNLTQGSVQFPDACAHIDIGANHIRIIGTKFYNIHAPVDNNGNPIPGIVGYEILRGSREGNKTVIAKGMINNMRGYITPQGTNGLYQNYPYNYWGNDITLVHGSESRGGWTLAGQPGTLDPAVNPNFLRKDIFTFHSPDTQFKHPFLSTNELKTYGELNALIGGQFTDVPEHPKEKLITDLAFAVAAFIGLAEAAVAVRGQQRTITHLPNSPTLSLDGVAAATYPPGSIPGGAATVIPLVVAAIAGEAALSAALLIYASTKNSVPNTLLFAENPNLAPADTTFLAAQQTANVLPGLTTYGTTFEVQDSKLTYMDPISRALGGVITYSTYWAIGTDTALRLIQAIVPYEQYAYRYFSTGFYNRVVTGASLTGQRRYLTGNLSYLSNQRQSFNNTEVNNLYRSEAVILNTVKPVANLSTPDFSSLVTIGNSPGGYGNPKIPFNTTSTSYYTALIQRIKNQYGQLEAIQQIPVSCPQVIDPTKTEQSTTELFGGDTYISQYTEKNTFFYFWDWLQGQPDGYEFDYRTRYMLTYPRFWADFTRFEAGDFLNLNFTAILPNDKAALDRVATSPANNFFVQLFSLLALRFRVKEAYFYLFQSGVRDFFVESEVNTDLRDYGDVPEERFYDPYSYTDLYSLFDPKIIKSGNFFKYDYSLSISRLFQNFISWGSLQGRSYDPFVAESCYVTQPKRLIYSLPQNTENKKDFWRVFLPNNYKDFYSEVSGIKSYNQNGAVILFESDSPILWRTVDNLETDQGTKITIGDGGLFSQPPQSIVNTDVSLEYGSCQDSRSVLNTPFGLYYICANQGKVFHITDTLVDITYHGLKFWFKEYLPLKLLQDFPNFQLIQNPVTGIGCQAVYDNQIETIYFTKKDYKLKPGFVPYDPNNPNTNPAGLTGVEYLHDNVFKDHASGITFILGDPGLPNGPVPTWIQFFDDASWTVSYDPKAEKGGWISWHDWHPDLLVPSKNDFLSTKGTSLWRHNSRRDLFTNYYGIDYPFEIEFIASTQFTVNTLRSIEYYLECYVYPGPTLDRFHQLDQNFDQAVVYNTEQVSGQLQLFLTPKNDPFGRLNFPFVNTPLNRIDILFSKEENKYRFNQFWDVTRDRGEFAPFAKQPIWVTDPNGYTRTLNQNNLNLLKQDLQRKKFREYLNLCSLTRAVSGPNNFIVKAVIEKDLVSLR